MFLWEKNIYIVAVGWFWYADKQHQPACPLSHPHSWVRYRLTQRRTRVDKWWRRHREHFGARMFIGGPPSPNSAKNMEYTQGGKICTVFVFTKVIRLGQTIQNNKYVPKYAMALWAPLSILFTYQPLCPLFPHSPICLQAELFYLCGSPLEQTNST